MRHALFVFALIDGQSAAVGVERLAQTADDAVPEDRKNAVYELCLFAVKGYVLIVEKAHKRLCGR